MKHVNLVYSEDRFRVVSVTNSTKFLPGQVLTKEEVDSVSGDPEWNVMITQDVNSAQKKPAKSKPSSKKKRR